MFGLGATAFGGPAMVAYIRQMAVERKGWLNTRTFDCRSAFDDLTDAPDLGHCFSSVSRRFYAFSFFASVKATSLAWYLGFCSCL